MTDILTIVQPDDWHMHLRDGEFLKTTVAHAAKQFHRVIVMPNLKPPICSLSQAKAYKQQILQAVPRTLTLEPLMTLYLTDSTSPETILSCRESEDIFACKLYPAGSTTHSADGVTCIKKLYPVFEAMQEIDLPLLIHGEVTDPEVDIFERETRFIDTTLDELVRNFPSLRIVIEHITTKEATQFVRDAPVNVAATITPHHLLLNRNSLFEGGLRPHHYCLPILKHRHDQEALTQIATSGHPRFFIGTDSAPHRKETKEAFCGCAGIYSAHAAIELYTLAFEQAGALDKLEGFCSFFGPDFYHLPRNKTTVSLIREEWLIPDEYAYANSYLIPFWAGTKLPWKLVCNDVAN